MEAFIAGAWRTVIRGEICLGGQWRALKRGETYKSATWRPSASFIPPLSVSANDAFGQRAHPLVTTSLSTAVPSGGVAPFSYAWSIIDGSASIGSPTSASTTFTKSVPPGEPVSVTAQVVVTDSAGNVASTTIAATFSNISAGA